MIRKKVDNSGGTVRLGYSFNCSSTPKPTIEWNYTPTNGFHVTIGDSEITVVVDENDTGSDSRSLVITPYIDGYSCSDNKITVSQGAGDEPGECSFSITASPSTFDCEGGNISFTYEKVDEGEPTGCKIPLTAKTINGLVYNYSTMRLDATGDTLTFSHGTSPDPPAGGCSGTWNKNSDLSTVFSKARGCTVLNNNWQACPNGTCTNSVTIVLKNTSGKQVPYNGHFRLIMSNGTSSYVDYRVQTPPKLAGGSGHYYYGASGAEGQQSNFIVPKNSTVERVCSADSEINVSNVTGAIVYFSNLESGENDYRLHNGQFNSTFDTPTISVSVENGKVVITSFAEKYCIDDGSTYKKNDKSSGNGTEIIPTNLWNM